MIQRYSAKAALAPCGIGQNQICSFHHRRHRHSTYIQNSIINLRPTIHYRYCTLHTIHKDYGVCWPAPLFLWDIRAERSAKDQPALISPQKEIINRLNKVLKRLIATLWYLNTIRSNSTNISEKAATYQHVFAQTLYISFRHKSLGLCNIRRGMQYTV
jgi:hypothetical protein